VTPPNALRSSETRLSNDTLKSALKPLDSLILSDFVARTDSALGTTAAGNSFTWSGHDAVEVHAVDTNGRIILDTKIDVFADTETEVASCGEVSFPQLVFLDLQSTF